MKKVKRNSRAHKKGYIQGLKGHSQNLCPFHTKLNSRAEWLGGWRLGHAEFLQGYRQGYNT